VSPLFHASLFSILHNYSSRYTCGSRDSSIRINNFDQSSTRTSPWERIIAFGLTFCLCLTKFALTSSSQAAGKALSGNRCTQTRWKSPNTLMPPDAGARGGRRHSSSATPQDSTAHSSPRRRAHRTGARHHHHYRRWWRRWCRQVSRSPRPPQLPLPGAPSGAVRRFLDSVVSGRQRRSQPASVVIQPLSSCRHLLRRSRSDPRRPLRGPPPSPPPLLACRRRRRHAVFDVISRNSLFVISIVFYTRWNILSSRFNIRTCELLRTPICDDNINNDINRQK